MSGEMDGLFLAVLGAGFGGIIAVLGFFSARLVKQQDKHADTLGVHSVTLQKHDTEIQHIKGRLK